MLAFVASNSDPSTRCSDYLSREEKGHILLALPAIRACRALEQHALIDAFQRTFRHYFGEAAGKQDCAAGPGFTLDERSRTAALEIDPKCERR